MRHYKFALLGSTIAAAAAFHGAAFAQQTAPAAATVEEVVVTGSLVVRNGNEAPTPVTVVDTQTLTKSAPTNIPDGLNQLPQFSGSRSESQNNQVGTAISPAAGNYLNLRNLGIVRSLILLDGQRVPPTSFEGTVDTNVLPQALVQRVDVVTAGASATYGSDALTGVVNFILDKKFTGLKGSLQKGISQQNDNGNYRVTLAGGMPLADGRGHVLFSAEHYQSDGIKDRADRPYMALGAIAFGNGTTIPYDIRYGARVANSTFGGMFTTGPAGLNFMKFEPDGRLTPFNRGTATIQQVQLGGDGSETVLGSLIGSIRTEQLFARGSWDFTDNLTGFVQATYGESRNRYAHVGADSRFGNMTIYSGNAFLRPEIQQIFTATNTASVAFSRHGLENGQKIVDSLGDSVSLFAGLEGNLFGDWTWKATYSGGMSRLRIAHTRNPDTIRLTAALDAVRDSSGKIVCRVSITNPGLYPGCVPLNFFGVGAPSKEALEYVYGQNSQYQVQNDLHDVAFTTTGTLFTLPAGPVVGAIGAEFRTQSLTMESNADPAVPLVTTGLRGFPAGAGRFGNTNQGAADGSQDVREVFGEVVVPLLRDMTLIQSLDFNGAFRVTDYSTSGQVETWKAGLSYTPISDLRIRATQSRDIRAPTLYELFAGAALSASTFSDIHTQTTGVATTNSSGNPNLVPEIGKTSTIGFVYQPSWFAGFTASVDYYNIEIEGAITRRSNTQINQDCEDSGGTSPACALIVRPLPFSDRSPANFVQRVNVAPLNVARTYTHGLDIDAGYRFPLSNVWDSSDAVLTLRALANYAPSYKQRETATTPVQQQAGVNAFNMVKLRTTLSVNYENGPIGVNLQQRRIGKLVRDNRANQIFRENDIDAVYYYNLAVTYKFQAVGGDMEAFANINNLFDKDPPLLPATNQPGLVYPTNQSLYDVVGRYYSAGIRFRF
jgi:outer membrane receptor protein involved in Fe transport